MELRKEIEAARKKNAKLESSRLPTPEPKVNAPPQSSSLFVQSALLRWSHFSSFVQSCAGEWSQHLHVRKEHSFRRFVGKDLALKQQQTGAAWWKLRATGPQQQSSKASPRRLHRFPQKKLLPLQTWTIVSPPPIPHPVASSMPIVSRTAVGPGRRPLSNLESSIDSGGQPSMERLSGMDDQTSIVIHPRIRWLGLALEGIARSRRVTFASGPGSCTVAPDASLSSPCRHQQPSRPYPPLHRPSPQQTVGRPIVGGRSRQMTRATTSDQMGAPTKPIPWHLWTGRIHQYPSFGPDSTSADSLSS